MNYREPSWKKKLSLLRSKNEVRHLLKNRGVMALLVGTAAFSAAEARSESSDQDRSLVAAQPVVALAPVKAEPADASISNAWTEAAVERETERLKTKYAQEGYKVSETLASDIAKAASKHEIDLEIAFGLVRAESAFKNSATSPVGAVGLTQLMPATARWMEPGVSRAELRSPDKNLDIGFKYLRYLLDKYEGDENLALLAYNRGPGTVDKALKRGRNPDNGYAKFVRGEKDHGHSLYTKKRRG